MLRPIGSNREATRFSNSLSVLAAAFSAGLVMLVGCSSDTGGGDPSTNDPAGSSPPEVAVTDPGTLPGDLPSVPDETTLERVPKIEEPELKPAGGSPGANPDLPSDGPSDPPAESPADLGIPPLDPNVVLTKPTVVLSDGHQQLCAVGVGDEMPSITLPDIAGNSQSLAQLLGRKLTVVVFWRLDQPYAKEQFQRLGWEVVDPLEPFGVNVVTVNVGDPAASVQAAGLQVGAAFPMLIDADGAVLATVGADKLPRTYLLDPGGQILWFDIEYSESTRRHLRNAILWHLTRGSTQAPRDARPR